MVHRLGSLLRIGIDGNEEISIKQELEHLKSYLEIQKFRFEDQFHYEIEVPENLLNFYILKLTLQPLVENSIQHGFDTLACMGFVSIKAVDEGECIGIYISDNGAGISSEKLAKFHYKMELETPFDEIRGFNEERRGLGVNNVADRIRIQYGARYGLFICSQEDEGTIMKIVIPKYRGESV
jgi:two-component system sensor histidine kinase YesM